MNKYYKFRSFEKLDYINDIIINNRLFCTPIEMLNDPFEGHFHAYFKGTGKKTLSISKDKTKICSVTKDMSEILLWIHYANGFNGVAIEFETDKVFTEVIYNKSLYIFKNENVNREDVYKIKVDKWIYENEYRYIELKNRNYIPVNVKEVILGNKVSKDNVLKLKNICDDKSIIVNRTGFTGD